MKKVHLLAGLALAMCVGGFTACSSSSDTTGGIDAGQEETDGTEQQLTVVIRSGNVGTRAAITTAPTTDAEKTINRITIGIFKADGTKVSVQEFTKGTDNTAGNAGTKTFVTSGGQSSLKMVTPAKSLNGGETVLAAVNAPAGRFNDVTTADDFKQKNETGEQALATDFTNGVQTSPVSANAPMYGEGTLTDDAANNPASGTKLAFKTNVTVKHLTSKITLNGIKLTLPDGDKFQLEKIYLGHVADGVIFNNNDNQNGATFNTVGTFINGFNEEASTNNLKEYLKAADYTVTAQQTADNIISPIYFYVTPNKETAVANRTVLYIKGKYFSGAADTQGTDVVYPVYLNATYGEDGSVKQAKNDYPLYGVGPNKNYTCSVDIRAKGIETDGGDKPKPGSEEELDPQTSTVTMTVAEWDDISQTTIFK